MAFSQSIKNTSYFRKLKNLTLLLSLGLLFNTAYAQNQTIDSLKVVWRNTQLNDTTRLNALQKISWDNFVYTQPDSAYYYAQIQYDFAEAKKLKAPMALALHTQGTVQRIKGDYDTALVYLNRSLKIYEQISDQKGLSQSQNSLGIVYEISGDYDKALEYYTSSLKISEEIGNKRGIAYTLSNIGIVYQYRGDLTRAIDYYSRGLKMHEEIGNNQGIAIAANNIGLIYEDMHDYPNALKYYNRCLKIAEDEGIKQEIATSLNNIGIIYEAQGEHAKAIQYHTRSLTISEEIGYRYGTSNALNNIGIIYQLQNDHGSAIDYCLRSLKIAEEIGNKNGIAYSLNTIARSYFSLGEYSKSISYSKRAMATANEIGSILKIRSASHNLYKAFEQLGDYKASLNMYELYIKLRDSIENIEGQKEVIRQEFKYDYEKQALADSLAFAKERELDTLAQQAKIQQERYALVIGFVLVLVFVVVFFRIRFIKNQAERESLLQDIKLLKVKTSVNLTSLITTDEQPQLDREKIESTIKTSLNPSDWDILNTLYHNPAIGNKEIADIVNLSVEGVRSSLKKMYRIFDIEKSANQRVLLVIEAAKFSHPVSQD